VSPLLVPCVRLYLAPGRPLRRDAGRLDCHALPRPAPLRPADPDGLSLQQAILVAKIVAF